MQLKIMSNTQKNRSKEINIFDSIILVYCLLQPLILKWSINKELIKYIQVFIAIYYTVKILKFNKIKKSTLIAIPIITAYILININKNGIQEYFYKNLVVYGIGNITVLVFFANFMGEKHYSLIYKILKKFTFIINLYFVLNIPIILLQLNNTYFMMRYHEGNKMYEDHITGLIGASGTHRLTFFWITLIIANIYYYNKRKSKKLLMYIIVQVCFMAIISSYSDNTAFFIIFPIILIQVLVLTMKRLNIISILKNMLYPALIILIAMPILLNNEQLKNFYETRVLEKIYQYTNQVDKYNSDIKEDEERIELYKYALEYGEGYNLGKGIGSVAYGDYRMPAHFGMSEISIKTYEGGVIYLILLILLFTYYSYKIILLNNDISYSRRLIIFIVIVIDFVLFSIYTQIFRSSEIIIFWAIDLCILRLMINQSCKPNRCIM